MQSVRISDLRFKDGTIVDCIMSILYVSDTEGVCFMDFLKSKPATPEIIPPSESKNVEVDPIALDSQWQFCEEDIALLESVLED
tara:strand:- start:273 stop:524 length:252 start_codon:yes stop_codon:yes gene_type:complete